MRPRYTREFASFIISKLKARAGASFELVGSVTTTGGSNNDIDLLHISGPMAVSEALWGMGYIMFDTNDQGSWECWLNATANRKIDLFFPRRC